MFWLLNLQCRDEREKNISPSLFPSNFQSSQFVFHTRRCKGINWLFQQWTFFSPREINGAISLLVCGARTSPRLTQKYANQRAWIRNKNRSHKSISAFPNRTSKLRDECNNWWDIPQKCLPDHHKTVVSPPPSWHRISRCFVCKSSARPSPPPPGFASNLCEKLPGKQYGQRQHSTTQHQARK